MSKLAYLLRQFLRNAQRLFQMLVGLMFLVLAAAGAAVSLSEWEHYVKSPSGGLVSFVLYASFTVLLIVFSLYSFAKARSIR